MIYKKEASFPHPVYYEDTSSYQDCVFEFDVINLKEGKDNYIFIFEYELQSKFLMSLLRNNEAFLNIIIQSNDNYFKRIKHNENTIEIPKSRLSLNKKTIIQLQIQSKKEVSFEDSKELTNFYQEFQKDIVVPKNSLLGFSNIVRYDGEGNKPLHLFEYETDPELKSEFKVELRPSTIVLVFRDEKYRMGEFNKNLSNMYVYAGLSQALTKFIDKNGKDEEYIDLRNLSSSNLDVLDQKLFDLMESKHVDLIDTNDTDEIIYKITDSIVGKYVEAVREVNNYGY